MVAITNYAASAALRALQTYSKELEVSQTRISTGYKVNSASDDATIWNIAQGLRSDIASNATTQSGLQTALTKTSVAVTAMDTIQSILGQMKTQLSNAVGATSTVKTSIQVNIASLQTQLKTVINSATVDGTNLLRDASFAVVTGINNGTTTTDTTTLTPLITAAAGTGGLLGTISGTYAANSVSGQSVLNMSVTANAGADSEIAILQAELSTVSTNVDTFATTISATQKRLTSQSDFLKTISQVKSTALGNLVNADLNEESAKLTALQTKQQLAVTALQIANASDAYVLRLFQ